MLCDELKVYVPQDGPYGLEPEEGGKLVEEETCYLKSEADAAIAELKARIQLDDDEMAGFLQLEEECGGGDLRNYIAELKQKLEDAKASHYAEMVDAGMRERRLRRALWLAREWRAWCEEQFWFVINGDEPRDVYHLIVTKRIHRTPTEWIDYWQKVEQKCKAKAEEYK